MKRPRPHIPLSVRVQVAERQVRESGSVFWPLYESALKGPEKLGEPWTLTRRLRVLLNELFPDGDCHLDHDPALILRRFNKRTGKYSPDANNPAFLIYRRKDDHLHKTTGRRPGAEKTITTKGSDVGLKTKFARLEKKVAPGAAQRMAAQRKQKSSCRLSWRSRPFQKGRKFR